jgi:TolB protein
LFLLQASGSGETRLTGGEANAYHPRWSPDGGPILFLTADSATGWWKPRTVSAGGGSWQTVPTPCAKNVYGLSWAPGGGRIAFECSHGGGLYAMRIDGTNALQVRPGADADAYVSDRIVTWSPDGSRLAISESVAGDEEILIFDLAGGSPVRVTHRPGADRPSDWR